CSGVDDLLRRFMLLQCMDEPAHKGIATTDSIDDLVCFVDAGHGIVLARVVGTIEVIVTSLIHKTEGVGNVFGLGKTSQYLRSRLRGVVYIGLRRCVSMKGFVDGCPQHLIRRPYIAHD